MFIVRKLKKRIDELQDELYELHFAKPSPEMYMQRRSEIEYKIACLEDTLEFEKKMAPFKWMLYGFIVCAFGLLLWAYLKSK
tara:strand:+ start:55 stop:300 length:246 start_codon:yes stop_codon:yes gene_type:complete